MIAIEELEARRVRLADELEKLESVIAAVKAYASAYAPDMLGMHVHIPEPQSKARNRTHPTKPSASVATITERTADAAWGAIVKANAPLSLGSIQEAIVAAGVPLGKTDNPKNVIGARLHNSKRFISTPNGWWIKNKPLPDSLKSEPSRSHENGEAEASPDAEEVSASPDKVELDL